MKASGTSLIFEEKSVDVQSIDACFDGLKGAMEDGYVLARSGNVFRYFFIIQGKPYTGAVIEGAKSSVTQIEEFFSCIAVLVSLI